MKFREYLESLNKLAEERPELLDMDTVYSRDDEGNGYQSVYWVGTVGYYDEGEFHSEEQVKESPEDFYYDSFEDFEPNSVCIN
jgi:hypothetical protein